MNYGTENDPCSVPPPSSMPNNTLTQALCEAVATIKDYLAYKHNGDPWEEDARAMGEMDINDYARDGRLARAEAALATSPSESSVEPVPHIGVVTNNNLVGWNLVVETAPNVTLPIGTKLYTEAALIAVGAGVAEDIWRRESSGEPSGGHDVLARECDRYAAHLTTRNAMLDAADLFARCAIALRRSPEPGAKPVQVYGLCDKHMHIGHFPAETAALPMPPIETVCPWCVRSTSTKPGDAP